MPILKKGHTYKNNNPKNSPYINSIMPIDDREVPKILFDSFEDITDKKKEKDENPT
jgi:hypothetical protein